MLKVIMFAAANSEWSAADIANSVRPLPLKGGGFGGGRLRCAN
jgi:hypothetical protein